ncbi:MAG TPA: DUF222 domain-containing protein, partial [Candidatus Sulfotelmatobacter sp.]|nr:DUF222 domain-containing protein [Candidatus Sulfotelmatobacter sp.]
MAKLPESVRAVQSGEIGYAHLALLARTADALSSAKADAQFDETRLLEHAKESSVSRFYFLCQSARHAADPQGFTADERSAYERRWLKLTPGEDGRFFIRGTLDGLGGATVKAALDPLARRGGPEDERSREQRLAGALVELAHHGLDHGASPQRAGQRTHIQVTATLETLTRHTGVPAGEVEPSVPISSKAVERLACDSTITRVLLRSDSAVLDVGRSQRVVPPATRRALEARDRGCRWPGCERSASWTAAHHLVHWSRGGRTDLDNLVLICGRHHWMVHEGGWRLARGENGQLMPIRPVGEYARRPAPELGERIVDQLGRTPVRELARPPGGREVA